MLGYGDTTSTFANVNKNERKNENCYYMIINVYCVYLLLEGVIHIKWCVHGHSIGMAMEHAHLHQEWDTHPVHNAI
jgi:hypothetical protein